MVNNEAGRTERYVTCLTGASDSRELRKASGDNSGTSHFGSQ